MQTNRSAIRQSMLFLIAVTMILSFARVAAAQALADTQREWLVKLRKEKGLAEAVTLAGPFIMSSQGETVSVRIRISLLLDPNECAVIKRQVMSGFILQQKVISLSILPSLQGGNYGIYG